MHKRIRDNSEARATFLAKKAEIDTALVRLTALSANHFDADPDTLNLGHVGTLEFYANHLPSITDMAFHEGEHAE